MTIAAIATTFQRELKREMLKLRLQFFEREGFFGFGRFTSNRQHPRVGIDSGRRDAVVAHKQHVGGRYSIIEQVCRRFRIDWPVVEYDQLRMLPGQPTQRAQKAFQCYRQHAARKVGRVHHFAAQNRAHGSYHGIF